MSFFDYCLASALPQKEDFLCLKRHKLLNERLFEGNLPSCLSKGFANRLKKRDFSELKKFYQRFEKSSFSFLRLDQKGYPPLLKQIPDPPVYLFVFGSKRVLLKPALAFVGSRRATSYGKKVSAHLIYSLSSFWVIVSGLAIGIDSFAHRFALESGKKTVAVLGSGFWHLYPVSNRGLAEKIASENGAVISEYPPHFRAQKYFFPARNRIIAGLSLGTVVVEAGKHSGALITASLSAKYGREVFVVPHSLFRLTGEGCFSLMRQGAMPISKAEEIEEVFAQLPLLRTFSRKKPQEKKDKWLKFLTLPRHLEEIARTFSLSTDKVLTKLSELEVEGKVKSLGGGFYQAV
ncbi:DNA-processing protein DprA [bacterium]|nr:DNA-processing protein DprA [bacterium]